MVWPNPSHDESLAESYRRLGVLADRLCPILALRSDEPPEALDFSLGHVVALGDLGKLPPTPGLKDTLLVGAIRKETLLRLAQWWWQHPGEHSRKTWRSQLRRVRNELADLWGEPVSGIIERLRHDPDFCHRLEEKLADQST